MHNEFERHEMSQLTTLEYIYILKRNYYHSKNHTNNARRNNITILEMSHN